jgi:hypothetical protein
MSVKKMEDKYDRAFIQLLEGVVQSLEIEDSQGLKAYLVELIGKTYETIYGATTGWEGVESPFPRNNNNNNKEKEVT